MSHFKRLLICLTLGYKMITYDDNLNVTFKGKWTKLANVYQNSWKAVDDNCLIQNGIKLFKFES